ncbi:MAG: DUF4058 family protein [Tepidisphaeraceae bacterium]
MPIRSPFPGMGPYLEVHWPGVQSSLVAHVADSPNARLPDIAVPLRPQDPRVGLDLQRLVEETYANGRYGRTIDYSRPLDPPLAAEELRWVQELLAGLGKA